MRFGSIQDSTATTMSGLAADGRNLNALKNDAARATPETIKETAKQFESLFMRELIKSMRDATVKSGMLDNPGTDLGTDLLDQQFAVQMSGQPGGLSDLIAQQLTRQMGVTQVNASTTGEIDTAAEPATLKLTSELKLKTEARQSAKTSRGPTETQAKFVRQHSEVAAKIEKESGIPASFMLGQAGHETGWGQFQIKMKGGASANNLFGIKAGAGWTGKVAEVTTTEYIDGTPQKRVARFRAYDSVEDSFKDYARMISESPRYEKVRTQTGSAQAFASGLQKAGYATDPEYAAKLSRAIQTTQQLRRVQV